jgi:hypothetical protein
MIADDGDITAELLADASKLTGLSLNRLGYEPHPDELSEDERAGLELDDLEEMASVPAEERAESLRQAKLLAGLLWHSSVVLVDQLYSDLATVSELDEITAEDISGTWVLSSLPPRFSSGYDGPFVRRFIVIASDLTGTLVRGWDSPGCVAAELALRCLLDQAEVTAELYDLDLADDWRSRVEEFLLEDTDSDMLYPQSLDGFENDDEMSAELGLAPMRFKQWFEPFNVGYNVPPYARTS